MATWEQQTSTFSMNIKSRECTTNMQWLCKTWHQSYPWKTKSAQEKLRILRKKNLTPLRKSEIHMEFMRSLRRADWNHERSTLVQSGFQESWWAEAMECCCHVRNVQDLPADGQTPHERRFNSPVWWAEHSFSSRSRILPFNKRPRSSASVRYKSPSLHIYGIRLERGRKLDWTQRRMAVNHSCVPSGGRSQAIIIIWRTRFRRSRRSPRSRSRCRSSTRCLKYHGTWHTLESCCSEYETLCSEGRFFRYLWIIWMSRDERNWSLMCFMRQPTNVYCNTYGDKSVSEPWIGVTRFELLNKDPPEGHMWVSRQTGRRNRCPQDLQLAGRIVKQRRHLLHSGRWS